MIYSGPKACEQFAEYSSQRPMRVKWRIESSDCDWFLQKLARLELPAIDLRDFAARTIVDVVGVEHIHQDATNCIKSNCVRDYRRISADQPGRIGFRSAFDRCRPAQQRLLMIILPVLRLHIYAFASRIAFSAFF